MGLRSLRLPASSSTGVPGIVYLAQLVEFAVFVGGAVLIVSVTDGVSVTDFSTWWVEPVIYQKFVVWTLLWQILGLGASQPPSHCLWPLSRSVRHWLRPGSIRLAPWPTRVPLTAGTSRTTVDVGLYVMVLGVAVWLVSVTGSAAGTLPSLGIWALLVPLALLGLRDTTVFLAARPERYAVMLVVFLLPPENVVLALKLVMVATWWGIATSRLTRHFPFAAAVRVSGVPWARTGRISAVLWRSRGADLRPTALVHWTAHVSTGALYVLPMILLLSGGGIVTTLALAVMVTFQVLAVASAFPFGASPEGAAFVIYSTLFLFGHYAGLDAGPAGAQLLAALPATALLVYVLLGNLVPGLVSVPATIRRGSGNEARSIWLLENHAVELFESSIGQQVPTGACVDSSDDLAADLERYRALAARAAQANGRALTGLLRRAVDDPSRYTPRDGVSVGDAATGGDSGGGHAHERRLLAAVQERCRFETGQLRVITVVPQPVHRAEQRYRIIDAADGVIEVGLLDVDDIVHRKAWPETDEPAIPVEVLFNKAGFAGYTTPADFAFLADRDRDRWHGLEDECEAPVDSTAPVPAAKRPRPIARPPFQPPRPTPRPVAPTPKPAARPQPPQPPGSSPRRGRHAARPSPGSGTADPDRR